MDASLAEFTSWSHQLLNFLPWLLHLTSVSLNFYPCEMWVITVPTSLSGYGLNQVIVVKHMEQYHVTPG